MSYWISIPCPQCETPIEVLTIGWSEYQGAHPVGGMVEFVETDRTEQACECELDDEQWEAICDAACEQYDAGEDVGD